MTEDDIRNLEKLAARGRGRADWNYQQRLATALETAIAEIRRLREKILGGERMNLLCRLGVHRWQFVMTAFTFSCGDIAIDMEWHNCKRCGHNKMLVVCA